MPQVVLRDWAPAWDAKSKTWVRKPVTLVVNAQKPKPTPQEIAQARQQYLQQQLTNARTGFVNTLKQLVQMELADAMRAGYTLTDRDMQRILAHPAVQRYLQEWLTNPLAVQQIENLRSKYKLQWHGAVNRYLQPMVHAAFAQSTDEATLREIQGQAVLEQTEFSLSRGLSQVAFGSFLPGIIRTVGRGLEQVGLVPKGETEKTLREMTLMSATFEGKTPALQAGEATWNFLSAVLSPAGVTLAGIGKFGGQIAKLPPIAKAMKKPAVKTVAKAVGTAGAVALAGSQLGYDVALARAGNVVGALTDVALNFLPIGGLRRAEAKPSAPKGGALKPPAPIEPTVAPTVDIPKKPTIEVHPTGGSLRPPEATTKVSMPEVGTELPFQPNAGEEVMVLAKETPTGVAQVKVSRQVQPQEPSALKLNDQQVAKIVRDVQTAIAIARDTGEPQGVRVQNAPPDFQHRLAIGFQQRDRFGVSTGELEEAVQTRAKQEWQNYFQSRGDSPVALLDRMMQADEQAKLEVQKLPPEERATAIPRVVQSALEQTLTEAGIQERAVRDHIIDVYYALRPALKSATSPDEQMKLRNAFAEAVTSGTTRPPVRLIARDEGVADFQPDKQGIIPQSVSAIAGDQRLYERAVTNYVLATASEPKRGAVRAEAVQNALKPENTARMKVVLNQITGKATPEVKQLIQYVKTQTALYGQVAKPLADWHAERLRSQATLEAQAQPEHVPQEIARQFKVVQKATGLSAEELRLAVLGEQNARVAPNGIWDLPSDQRIHLVTARSELAKAPQSVQKAWEELVQKLPEASVAKEAAQKLEKYGKAVTRGQVARLPQDVWAIVPPKPLQQIVESAEAKRMAVIEARKKARGERITEEDKKAAKILNTSPVYLQSVDNPRMLFEIDPNAYVLVGRKYVAVFSATNPEPDNVILFDKQKLLNSNFNLVFSRADLKGNEHLAPYESSWLGEIVEGFHPKPAIIVDDPKIIYDAYMFREAMRKGQNVPPTQYVLDALETLRLTMDVERKSEQAMRAITQKEPPVVFPTLLDDFAKPQDQLKDVASAVSSKVRQMAQDANQRFGKDRVLAELSVVTESVKHQVLQAVNEPYVGAEGYERVKRIARAIHASLSTTSLPKELRSLTRPFFRQVRPILTAWVEQQVARYNAVRATLATGNREGAEQYLRTLGYTGSLDDWLAKTEQFLQQFNVDSFDQFAMRDEYITLRDFRLFSETEWMRIRDRLRGAEQDAQIASQLPKEPESPRASFEALLPRNPEEAHAWAVAGKLEDSPYVDLIDQYIGLDEQDRREVLVAVSQLPADAEVTKHIEGVLTSLNSALSKYSPESVRIALALALKEQATDGLLEPTRLPDAFKRASSILRSAQELIKQHGDAGMRAFQYAAQSATDLSNLKAILAEAKKLINQKGEDFFRDNDGTVLYSVIAPPGLARVLYYLWDASLKMTGDVSKVIEALAIGGRRAEEITQKKLKAIGFAVGQDVAPTITEEIKRKHNVDINEVLDAAATGATPDVQETLQNIKAVFNSATPVVKSVRVGKGIQWEAEKLAESIDHLKELMRQAEYVRPDDEGPFIEEEVLDVLHELLRLNLDFDQMGAARPQDIAGTGLLAALARLMEQRGLFDRWRQKLEGQKAGPIEFLENFVPVEVEHGGKRRRGMKLSDLMTLDDKARVHINGEVLSSEQVKRLAGFLHVASVRLFRAIEAYKDAQDPAKREALAHSMYTWYYLTRFLAGVFRGNAAEAGRLLRTYRRDVITFPFLRNLRLPRAPEEVVADLMSGAIRQMQPSLRPDQWAAALLNGYDPAPGIDLTGWQTYLVGNLLMTPRSSIVQQLITNILQDAVRLGTQAFLKVKQREHYAEPLMWWIDRLTEQLIDVNYAASMLPADERDLWYSAIVQTGVPAPLAQRAEPRPLTLPKFFDVPPEAGNARTLAARIKAWSRVPYEMVFGALRRADLRFAFAVFYRTKADLLRRSPELKLLVSTLQHAKIPNEAKNEALRLYLASKMVNPDDRLDAFALQQSMESTFQIFAPGPISQMPVYRAMRGILELRRSLGTPGLVLMPILSFAMESLRQGAEMSLGPLTRLRPFGKQKWKPIPREEAPYLYAKWMVGASLLLTGYYLRRAGVLTTSAPQDKRERESFYALGYRPYSLLLGDYAVPYVAAGPFMFPLAIGGMLYDVFGDPKRQLIKGQEDILQKLYAAGGRVGSMTVDQTVLYTLQNLFGVLSGDPTAGEVFGTAVLQPSIPGYAVLRSTRWMLDPALRDPEGFAERVMNFLPFLSRRVPPKYTWSGKVNEYQFANKLHQFAFAFLLPVTKRGKDPLTLTLATIGYTPADVQRDLNFAAMTASMPRADVARYQYLTSFYFAQFMRPLVSEDGKRNMVLEVLRSAQQTARTNNDPRSAIMMQEALRTAMRRVMATAALMARTQLIGEDLQAIAEGKAPKGWAVKIPVPNTDVWVQPYQDFIDEQEELGLQELQNAIQPLEQGE